MLVKLEVLAGVTELPRFLPWEFNTHLYGKDLWDLFNIIDISSGLFKPHEELTLVH